MLYLHGLGHCHPGNVIDNKFLEALDIDTNDEWIMERVGIKQRRTVLSLDYIKSTHNKNPVEAAEHIEHTTRDLSAKALEMALGRAGITKEQIGMIVAGGCSAQHLLPAEACVLGGALGINAPAFDISAACSTFVVQLHVLSQMNALPDYVLILIPESWTLSTDYSDRKTAVLTGDCCVAAIVSPRIPAKFVLRQSLIDSNPSGWDKARTPVGRHFSQEGPSIQKMAIRKVSETLNKLQTMGNFDKESLYFIGHQANLIMLQSVCQRADIREGKHLYNVDRYGNCAAAGAPSVMSEHWDTFVEGDRIFLAVVGAGLTWGGVIIETGASQ